MKCHTYLTFIVLLGVAAPVGSADKESVIFTEKFEGKLADGWSWVREDAAAWKLDGGAMVMRTSPGGLWKTANNSRNLLLCATPDAKEGYAIEVQVECEPTNAFEHGGLVWYIDDDNYAILVKEKVGDKVVVQLVSEKESKPHVGFAEKGYEGKSIWLRLSVTGGKMKGQYRAKDSDNWQTVGEGELPSLEKARVGLITGYAPKTPEHSTRFSGFRILQPAK